MELTKDVHEKDHMLPGIEKEQRREILVVTGLSGSGKSTVMRSLEDLGFYCVDNFPVPLLSTFLDFVFQSQTNLLKVAMGVDARGGDCSDSFLQEIEKLKKQNYFGSNFKILFLNASDETLVKRFQETRRTHPLAQKISLNRAIKKERALLAPLKKFADQIHNTDQSTIHELRKWVRGTFVKNHSQEVIVNLISFGFKYGVPAQSNLVYDLRFLPNPYFVPGLKILNGRDSEVSKYLFEREEVNIYWDKLVDFLSYLLQQYYEEGRFFANVSVGCTGGKHRSVAFAERLSTQKWPNIKFLVYHRDVGKE